MPEINRPLADFHCVSIASPACVQGRGMEMVKLKAPRVCTYDADIFTTSTPKSFFTQWETASFIALDCSLYLEGYSIRAKMRTDIYL